MKQRKILFFEPRRRSGKNRSEVQVGTPRKKIRILKVNKKDTKNNYKILEVSISRVPARNSIS